jgi:hypothetical protein
METLKEDGSRTHGIYTPVTPIAGEATNNIVDSVLVGREIK